MGGGGSKRTGGHRNRRGGGGVEERAAMGVGVGVMEQVAIERNEGWQMSGETGSHKKT